MYPSILQW